MTGRVPARRDFLRGLSLGAIALAGASPAPRWLRPRFGGYPFSLGVASGDPAADGFVLWTRLTPDPLRGGGMPPATIRVEWEIGRDETMRRVVRRGAAVASPELAHSVHVEVAGLDPDRPYWYRFRAGGETSPIGRARTMPAAGAPRAELRLAVASCQHYEHGYFTAYRHVLDDDPDLVTFLGDYIYEGAGVREAVRMHTGGIAATLEDYRARYALYRTDPDLQALHAACPWLVTWDDHEVANNYAGALSDRNDPVDAFLARRAAAYQAYYEHQPVRAAARPRGPDARLYRVIEVGRLARLFMLDTRQYRTDQPCGDRLQPPCPAQHAPESTMLGAEQERWLFDGLARPGAQWNVLAQQVFVTRRDEQPGPGEKFYMDSWGGYPASRARLLDHLAERTSGDTVVLTGDIHSSWAADLVRDHTDPAAPAVAAELVATSITSGGDGQDAIPSAAATIAENPQVKFHNARRGYLRCTVTPARWRADFRVVPWVSRPDAPAHTERSFAVEHGRPGLEPA